MQPQLGPSWPGRILSRRSIKGVAEYITKHNVKNIVVMCGAGISTSAGIPDFRSADTGLYSMLDDYDLPEPEDIFDISFFLENPRPFYRLAAELAPAKHRPTVVHSFIRLLEKKGLLRMCFTQNIDALERKAGVSDDKLIEAHGSFVGQTCGRCRRPQHEKDEDETDEGNGKETDSEEEDAKRRAESEARLQTGIETGKPVVCKFQGCDGFVKPDIVFFGEPLPEKFRKGTAIPAEADLAIVLGTSLTVFPFAALPQLVRENIPRLLFNLEMSGDIGARPDDVVALGSCDCGVRELAAGCGWIDELEALWAETAPGDGRSGALANPTVDAAAILEQDSDGVLVERPLEDDDIDSQLQQLTDDVGRISSFEHSLQRFVGEVQDGGSTPTVDEQVVSTTRDAEIDGLVLKSANLSLDSPDKTAEPRA